MTAATEATVIVTGAASGIGEAVARLAAQRGLRLALWDLNGPAVETLADDLDRSGHTARAFVVDASEREAVAETMSATVAWSTPSLLVNNAGPPSAAATEFFAGVHAALAPVELITQAWLELAGDEAESVVNVASVAGNVNGLGPTWYQVAKAGIVGYTRSLAATRPHGVRANAVAPGIVATPRVQSILDSPVGERMVARIPRGTVGQPAEIAAAILFLLSPEASFVNGELLVADGGARWTL